MLHNKDSISTRSTLHQHKNIKSIQNRVQYINNKYSNYSITELTCELKMSAKHHDILCNDISINVISFQHFNSLWNSIL